MSENKSYTSENPIFELLQQLAENNPDEFEVKRDELINEFLATLPKKYQRGMQGLQWRINKIREIAKTPLSACIEISKMMFTSVEQLHSQAYSMQLRLNGETALPHTVKSATILDFKTTDKTSILLTFQK